MAFESTRLESSSPATEEEKKHNRDRYNRRYSLSLIDFDEMRLFSTYADKTTLKDIWE